VQRRTTGGMSLKDSPAKGERKMKSHPVETAGGTGEMLKGDEQQRTSGGL